MAAVITTEKINKSFENGMEFLVHLGGNPVSCEIGKCTKNNRRRNFKKSINS